MCLRPRHLAGSAGFSLLEMLVALAVFSIAALALIKLQGASLMQTAELDSRLYTEVVVRNLAVEALTDPNPPSLGDSQGSTTNAGRSFTWRRTTTALEGGEMLRVDLAVKQATGPEVTLTVLRPML
ncbi:type II secretion system minor pseudopilin GspI [Blastomonas sp.]|uniref:type II secretion system minor pseudopilin GspI n=1 Tax=Blastomonas sp. TaxID=1909299 RepID=UPI002620CDBC|nr:type II secretion system minor pseudopilin GspI [Blastomonas sp.]MDM7957853.1 type II secretion system minor pseudopilin GspI [Blastomonas sp.]